MPETPETLDEELVSVNFKVKQGLYKEFQKILIDEHLTISDFLREQIRRKVADNTGAEL